ncbi:MAG: twin-arginine translocation signal domain-containing protein, partial [Comamonas sp.]
MQNNATANDRRTFLLGAAATAATAALPATPALARSAVSRSAPDDAITKAGQLRAGEVTPLEALDAAIA